MANERDEQKPRFQIIDNRLLSEEERKGTSSSVASNNSTPLIQVPGGQQNVSDAERPKLEIIGGGAAVGSSSLKEEPGEAVSAPIASGDAADASETVPADGFEDELSDDEVLQMQAEMEAEQFAQLEQEVGRTLTEEEKGQVRQLMAQQAQTMSRLEVTPLLLQTVSELPRYAAVHLGLLANPYSGLLARNDAEARLAIEAFAAIVEVIKPRGDARINGELNRVLTDLKTNFTRITGATIGPVGGPRIIR